MESQVNKNNDRMCCNMLEEQNYLTLSISLNHNSSNIQEVELRLADHKHPHLIGTQGNEANGPTQTHTSLIGTGSSTLFCNCVEHCVMS